MTGSGQERNEGAFLPPTFPQGDLFLTLGQNTGETSPLPAPPPQ